MVLLDCCFINCFSPSHNGKIKDVFCRAILSSSDSSLEESFTDQVLATTESAGSITIAWPLFFRSRLKNFLWTVLAHSLPNNILVKLNLQPFFSFLVLYATVNASLVFYADYQCFMNL